MYNISLLLTNQQEDYTACNILLDSALYKSHTQLDTY